MSVNKAGSINILALLKSIQAGNVGAVSKELPKTARAHLNHFVGPDKAKSFADLTKTSGAMRGVSRFGKASQFKPIDKVFLAHGTIDALVKAGCKQAAAKVFYRIFSEVAKVEIPKRGFSEA